MHLPFLILLLLSTGGLHWWPLATTSWPLVVGQLEESEQTSGLREKIGIAPHNRPSCQVINSQLSSAASNHKRLSSQTIAQQAGEEIKVPILEGNKTTATPSILGQQKKQNPSAENNELKGKSFDSSERLRQLRQLLTNNNYDAYLVTPNDEHGSEYVTDYDRRLRFISGFTGSNGYALILMDRAVLFTDGRYALQADQELDCNWWLVVGDAPEAEIYHWLRGNSVRGIKVATDARLMSLQLFEFVGEGLKKLDSDFALISQDLVDVVWNNFQASGTEGTPVRLAPKDGLFVHPLKFSGNFSWQEKLVQLADSMERLKARHYIVSGLDDIAWLLNLRGNDIPMSPLFKAYLFISQSGASPPAASFGGGGKLGVEQLLLQQASSGGLQAPQVVQVQPNQFIRVTMYVDLSKVGQAIREHLCLENGTLVTHKKSPFKAANPNNSQTVTTRIQLELKDYDVFIMDIREKLTPSLAGSGQFPVGGNSAGEAVSGRQLQGLLLLEAQANVAIHVLAKAHEERMILLEGLIVKLKSVKTDAEVEGMRLAHWRDSLAISMLLAQLEEEIERKSLEGRWSETSAARQLEFYRSLMDFNKGQSFHSISAYGAQAAIVHYQPKEEEQVMIRNESTFLLDTGGQYLDGTTDITRTCHFGRPTNFQREAYTRVLMGAIDMMSLVWEQSSRSSFRLNDLLARRHLLELGLDYKHGTGHGIGLYSLVHESPRIIENYMSAGPGSQLRRSSELKEPPINFDLLPLQANMFTSVEPGYYKANDFGIRLENIVVSQRISLPASLIRQNDRQEGNPQQQQQGKSFLRFEPISLVPFEPKLIKLELLSNKQKAWLNSYNLMVRLRMTQQINYYISKLRDNNHLARHSNRTNNPDGYYNFMAMPAEQLKERLELTHRWLLSKTEIIPLDIPRALVGGQPAEEKLAGRKSTGPEAQSSSSGHRLMLTYMSSLPFNDQEAAEALLSLQEQLQARVESGRSNSSLAPAKPDKCVGLDCDLWLLEAMNSIAAAAAANKRQLVAAEKYEQQQQLNSKASQSMPTTWSESLMEPDERLGASSLLGLFQLGAPSSLLSLINMWPLMLMFLLLILQMGLIVFMCARRRPRQQQEQLQSATTGADLSASNSIRRRSSLAGESQRSAQRPGSGLNCRCQPAESLSQAML